MRQDFLYMTRADSSDKSTLEMHPKHGAVFLGGLSCKRRRILIVGQGRSDDWEGVRNSRYRIRMLMGVNSSELVLRRLSIELCGHYGMYLFRFGSFVN